MLIAPPELAELVRKKQFVMGGFEPAMPIAPPDPVVFELLTNVQLVSGEWLLELPMAPPPMLL